MKIYTPHNFNSAYEIFRGYGIELVGSAKDAELVVLQGGADISPEIYGEENVASVTDLRRDMQEVYALVIASVYKIPVLGICRGIQLIAGYCGGKLIQDLRHTSPHEMRLASGEVVEVNSYHHQGVTELPPGFKSLGTHKNIHEAIQSDRYFGVQFHPEFGMNRTTTQWFFETFEDWFFCE